MTSLTDWIAVHIVLIWALLLSLGVLVGDRAWHYNVRWQENAIVAGREPALVRAHGRLLLMMTMGLIFGAIVLALGASHAGALARFDSALAASLHAYLALPLVRVVAWITRLGGTYFIAPCAGVVALLLFLRQERELATIWLGAVLAITPLSSGLKALFQRARPPHEHGVIVEHGWSFPSGHAFAAIVFYGMLAYVLLRVLPKGLHRAVIAAVLLVGSIGASRITLQVHYLSDVVAGYATGAAWLLACVGFAEVVHAKQRQTSTQPTRPMGDRTHD